MAARFIEIFLPWRPDISARQGADDADYGTIAERTMPKTLQKRLSNVLPGCGSGCSETGKRI
jgi:hypothetical protein